MARPDKFPIRVLGAAVVVVILLAGAGVALAVVAQTHAPREAAIGQGASTTTAAIELALPPPGAARGAPPGPAAPPPAANTGTPAPAAAAVIPDSGQVAEGSGVEGTQVEASGEPDTASLNVSPRLSARRRTPTRAAPRPLSVETFAGTASLPRHRVGGQAREARTDSAAPRTAATAARQRDTTQAGTAPARPTPQRSPIPRPAPGTPPASPPDTGG